MRDENWKYSCDPLSAERTDCIKWYQKGEAVPKSVREPSEVALKCPNGTRQVQELWWWQQYIERERLGRHRSMGPPWGQGARPHAQPQEKRCNHCKTQYSWEGFSDLHSISDGSQFEYLKRKSRLFKSCFKSLDSMKLLSSHPQATLIMTWIVFQLFWSPISRKRHGSPMTVATMDFWVSKTFD